MNRTATLELITPLFSRGMTDTPEIRAASIRGQLHWWFRALGGTWKDETAVFGRIGSQRETRASRLVVRVTGIEGRTGELPTLPHKHGGHAAPKPCFLPGTRFTVLFATRLGPLSEQQLGLLERTIDIWLLAGSLGLRSTRAAGAFMWLECPQRSVNDYLARIQSLSKGAPVRIVPAARFEDDGTASPEDLRRDATDTIGGRDDRPGEGLMQRLHDPFGSIRPRKTSPLRLRPIQLAEGAFLLAIWDARREVTGNTPQELKAAIDALAQARKRIGLRLKRSALYQ